MNAERVEPQGWSRRFRWLGVVFVFTLQLGLIFWLSDSRPAPSRARPAAPVLQLGSPGPTTRQWLALVDPTLFARPHEQGFSGQAWMAAATQDFPAFTWSEPPDWLVLPATGLGIAFNEFITTNVFDPPHPLNPPPPELALPSLPPVKMFPEESTLELAGPLAKRELLSKPALRSWPAVEILTNSVVQTVVDADGRAVSVALFPPGSGSREADQQALHMAWSARFKPDPSGNSRQPLAGLTFGQMIFVWNTVPLSQTNSEGGK